MDRILNQIITISYFSYKSTKTFVHGCKIETQSTLKSVNRLLCQQSTLRSVSCQKSELQKPTFLQIETKSPVRIRPELCNCESSTQDVFHGENRWWSSFLLELRGGWFQRFELVEKCFDSGLMGLSGQRVSRWKVSRLIIGPSILKRVPAIIFLLLYPYNA